MRISDWSSDVCSSDLSAGGLAGAVAIGILHDLCMGFALGLPFLIGLYLLGFVWRRAAGRWLAHLLLIAFCGVLVFSSVAELFFWNEFSSRFNGIAVTYLIFPRSEERRVGQTRARTCNSRCSMSH